MDKHISVSKQVKAARFKRLRRFLPGCVDCRSNVGSLLRRFNRWHRVSSQVAVGFAVRSFLSESCDLRSAEARQAGKCWQVSNIEHAWTVGTMESKSYEINLCNPC